MKKTLKLKKNYEFNRVLKKGFYFGGNQIEGFYLKNGTNKNYIGIAISSKICNAVNRNRIKRRIREAYKEKEKRVNLGYNFVFLWKKKVNIKMCSYHSVYKDMKTIFEKQGLMRNE